MDTTVLDYVLSDLKERAGRNSFVCYTDIYVKQASAELSALKERLAVAERIMARLDEYGSLNIDNGDNLYDIIDAARAFWRPKEPKRFHYPAPPVY